MANAHLQNEDDIRKGIARADFVRKGIQLYLPSSPSCALMNSLTLATIEIEAL